MQNKKVRSKTIVLNWEFVKEMAVEETHLLLIHKCGRDPVNVYLKSFPGDSGVHLVKKHFYKSTFPKIS